MKNDLSRKLGLFAGALVVGSVVAVAPASSASAMTYGYHVSAPTQGECTGKLGAIKQRLMREGRNITLIRNCYWSAGNFYQGNIRYSVKSSN